MATIKCPKCKKKFKHKPKKKKGKLKGKIITRIVRANEKITSALADLEQLNDVLARPYKKNLTALARAAKDTVAIEEMLLPKETKKKKKPKKKDKPKPKTKDKKKKKGGGKDKKKKKGKRK
jgi:hypothetical protein